MKGNVKIEFELVQLGVAVQTGDARTVVTVKWTFPKVRPPTYFRNRKPVSKGTISILSHMGKGSSITNQTHCKWG